MRDQKNYNAVIGRAGDEIYALQYTFDDELHGKPFRGAVGSVFRAVSQQEYEERTTPEALKEWLREPWQEACKNGGEERSLTAYCQDVKDTDGTDFVFDPSHSDIWPKIRAAYPEYKDEGEFPMFECVGGGRCFSRGMKMKVLPAAKKLWAEIRRLEKSGK